MTIYKKGHGTEYGSYRGISLIYSSGKIFVRILLNRVASHITTEWYLIRSADTFKPEHSVHCLLSVTTPGKVHRARSSPVYCLCRLHQGIRHSWEDRNVDSIQESYVKATHLHLRSIRKLGGSECGSAEEIWMPWKVHNHGRKFAHRKVAVK